MTHNTVHPPGALGRTPHSATSSVLQKRLDPLRPGMRLINSPHRAAEAGSQPVESVAVASSLVREPRAGLCSVGGGDGEPGGSRGYCEASGGIGGAWAGTVAVRLESRWTQGRLRGRNEVDVKPEDLEKQPVVLLPLEVMKH